MKGKDSKARQREVTARKGKALMRLDWKLGAIAAWTELSCTEEVEGKPENTGDRKSLQNFSGEVLFFRCM
ncbi:unnamed protein product [Calypogeia fissa]